KVGVEKRISRPETRGAARSNSSTSARSSGASSSGSSAATRSNQLTDAPLLALHEEGELLLRFGMREELVAGLLGKSLEVLHRAGVGRDDLEHLPGLHVVQGLLRAQDGQRTVEAAGIEFFVEVHEEILI